MADCHALGNHRAAAVPAAVSRYHVADAHSSESKVQEVPESTNSQTKCKTR